MADESGVSWRRVALATGIAAALSIAANLLVLWGAVVVVKPDPGFRPLSALQVVGLTIFGVGLAGLAFGWVYRKASGRLRTWRLVALAALVVSFVPDVGLLVAPVYPGTTLSSVGSLALMHVAAFAITVPVLERFGTPRPDGGAAP